MVWAGFGFSASRRHRFGSVRFGTVPIPRSEAVLPTSKDADTSNTGCAMRLLPTVHTTRRRASSSAEPATNTAHAPAPTGNGMFAKRETSRTFGTRPTLHHRHHHQLRDCQSVGPRVVCSERHLSGLGQKTSAGVTLALHSLRPRDVAILIFDQFLLFARMDLCFVRVFFVSNVVCSSLEPSL